MIFPGSPTVPHPRGARSVAAEHRVRVKVPALDCLAVMSVLLVRLRPGIDRSALNFLPVAVRERPGSSAISAGDFSFWHGAQYPPGADRQDQTILPGFASRF